MIITIRSLKTLCCNITIGNEVKIMATVIGSVGEFDSIQEDWESYIKRVEFYMAANSIDDDDKKRATLFAICGAKTYHTIRNLAAPTAPGTVPYKDVLTMAKEHYCLKPDVVVQRYKFNSRLRGKDESVAKFVEELRHIALYCEYKDSLKQHVKRLPHLWH